MHIPYWKFLSIAVVAVNAMIAKEGSAGYAGMAIIIMVSLPGLPLIFFSEEIAEGTHDSLRGYRRGKQPTPGWSLALLGWVWIFVFPMVVGPRIHGHHLL